MYSVRRFSTLEEREYNIVGDLYHSGLGRTSKKVIGKVRRGIGSRIEKSISNDIRKLDNSINKEDSYTKRDYYPRVKDNLSKEAKLRNSKVVDIEYDESLGGNRGDKFVNNRKVLESPEFKEILSIRDIAMMKGDISTYNEADEVIKDILGGKNVIYHSYKPTEGAEALAHEIGHADNYSSSNPIKRDIHRRSGGKYKDLSLISGLDQKGVLRSVKNYLNGLLVVNEESNATRTGLDLLKKSGVDSDALKESSEILKNSLNTYRYGNNINSKYPIRNSIQIPSRLKLGPSRLSDGNVDLSIRNDGFGGGRIRK